MVPTPLVIGSAGIPAIIAIKCVTGATVAACMLAVLVAAPTPAAALDVVRSGRALAGVSTQLRPVGDAPSTVLHPKESPRGLLPRTQDTTLRSSAAPQTVLREGEVPPARLEQTRALLVELKASPTPDQAISIDLPADVLFDFDKSELRSDAAASLDKASELVKSYPSAPLSVLGHTDGKGTDAYNDSLSLRRAEAVAMVLLRQTGRQPQVEGRGKRQPVAPNTTPDGRDDPQGRQLNRRVQILIGVPTPGKK